MTARRPDLTGGPVAARSQRRPDTGRRRSHGTEHPGACPWQVGVPASAAGTRPQFPAAQPTARRCRCGASVPDRPDPGRPPDGGVRGTYRVPRHLAAGQRPGVANRRGRRDSAGPRLPLRRPGRGPAARSRTTGLVRKPGDWPGGGPVQKRTERLVLQASHYRNRRITCPAQRGTLHRRSRRGNPAQRPRTARHDRHRRQVRPYGEQPAAARPGAGLPASSGPGAA